MVDQIFQLRFVEPVSYTHLDVYKRQALLRLSAGADSATGLGIEILDNNDVAIAINGESGFRLRVFLKNVLLHLFYRYCLWCSQRPDKMDSNYFR